MDAPRKDSELRMTIGTFLSESTQTLRDVGIESARLDVLLLLEDALDMDRARVLAHPEMKLSPVLLTSLNKKCAQRKRHLPLSYIRNKAYFYGRVFYVDTHVLVPRPESEAMITWLMSLQLPANVRIADIGTGSGCLGITAALELPESLVTLCDISPEALAVAKQNAATHSTTCLPILTDLLVGCPQPQDVLLANLPYVPDAYPINTAATHEPALALFAGSDGLEAYRVFWSQIEALEQKPSFVITESLENQHEALADLAAAAGYTQKSQADGLTQLFMLAASD